MLIYPGPTVAEVGEHAVIAAIQHIAPSARNGDDAAVLVTPAPNTRTVVSTDVLVEGQHFNRQWSWAEEIGKRAIVQNFADIEAMGARPVAALLGLSLPADTSLEFVERLAAGMHDRAREHNAEVVGGDIAHSKVLVISVTAVGVLGGSAPALTLDRARPGQRLVASGQLGHSAAGLALLQRFGRHQVPPQFTPLIDAHCAPHRTPGRGVVARATGATAMTDNSDGLIADLTTMARRSQVRIDIFSTAIKPDELLIAAAAELGVDPWTWVLTGGEDHTLLGTTHNAAPTGFHTVGKIYRKRGAAFVTVDGQEPHFTGGWTSF